MCATCHGQRSPSGKPPHCPTPLPQKYQQKSMGSNILLVVSLPFVCVPFLYQLASSPTGLCKRLFRSLRWLSLTSRPNSHSRIYNKKEDVLALHKHPQTLGLGFSACASPYILRFVFLLNSFLFWHYFFFCQSSYFVNVQ